MGSLAQSVPATQTGAPSKYDPDMLEDVAELALSGATDQDIANHLKIDRVTLYRWKHRYPAFRHALRESKLACDDAIQRTLYEKAREGDTTSMIFWLKNRRPQEWRESRDSSQSIVLNVSGVAAERLLTQLTQGGDPTQSRNPPMLDATVVMDDK